MKKLRNTEAKPKLEVQFMKKLRNTEAELKKMYCL